MANFLDEMNPVINEQGREINVIQKQMPVTIGTGTYVFIVCLFILGIIPGLIFLYLCVKAKQELLQIEQKINVNASEIDNYMVQRGQVLQNTVKLVERAVNLDQDTFTKIAAYRSGFNPQANSIEQLNETQERLDKSFSGLALAFENYPELRGHEAIADAMQQNSYLQREITASRSLYNDSVNQWNRKVLQWPTYQYVAFKQGYTTKIPFAASRQEKDLAKSVFF